MSYDIQLYRKEVKSKYTISSADDFFEKEDNLISFTTEQSEKLKNRLLDYGYVIDKEEKGMFTFSYKNDDGISAMLTKNCLYFSSTGEGIFEISMTASEFTDTGEFSKYDSQSNGWEEL